MQVGGLQGEAKNLNFGFFFKAGFSAGNTYVQWRQNLKYESTYTLK